MKKIQSILLEHSECSMSYFLFIVWYHFLFWICLIYALCSGYLSPEYIIDGLFSTKSDVFSFGVLVLEIVSGKRNRGFAHEDHHFNLLGHVSIDFKILFSLDINLEFRSSWKYRTCEVHEKLCFQSLENVISNSRNTFSSARKWNFTSSKLRRIRFHNLLY